MTEQESPSEKGWNFKSGRFEILSVSLFLLLIAALVFHYVGGVQTESPDLETQMSGKPSIDEPLGPKAASRQEVAPVPGSDPLPVTAGSGLSAESSASRPTDANSASTNFGAPSPSDSSSR